MDVTFTAETRYSFVGQHLEASAIFIRRIREIEGLTSDQMDEPVVCEHRGLVCAVIFQCAAALESEANEVCVHGPGCHLGSSGIDMDAKRFLSPLADLVDAQKTVARFNLILHLLHKEKFDTGKEPYQSAALVARLRNELIHYKSHWGTEMESTKLYRSLESMHHQMAPYATASMNFFPHRCLSADCAAWALSSTVAFLEAFYAALGVPSRFKDYRDRLIP